MYSRGQVEEAVQQAMGFAAAAFMQRHPEDELPDVLPSDEVAGGVARIVDELEVEQGDPDLERIRATLFVGQVPAGVNAGRHKVRLTIWSGQDFRTPSIRRGGIFDGAGSAEWVQDRLLEALDLLGIPVELESTAGPQIRQAAVPLLGGPVPECEDYPRLDREQVIDRLVSVLDPHGTNEQLAAWAKEAKNG